MVEIEKLKSRLTELYSQNLQRLEGCSLLKNSVHFDSRGSFRKVLPSPEWGLPIKQINVSNNPRSGTIRGLHYQQEPFSESKLVSCVKGSVLDVLLDLRPNSMTYGKCSFFVLTPSSGSLVVPPLVAHGYQSLEDETMLLYLHSNEYKPDHSRGVYPFDPVLGIDWPLAVSFISDSDNNLPRLSRVKIEPSNL